MLRSQSRPFIRGGGADSGARAGAGADLFNVELKPRTENRLVPQRPARLHLIMTRMVSFQSNLF